jgi:hypothetical protein
VVFKWSLLAGQEPSTRTHHSKPES